MQIGQCLARQAGIQVTVGLEPSPPPEQGYRRAMCEKKKTHLENPGEKQKRRGSRHEWVRHSPNVCPQGEYRTASSTQRPEETLSNHLQDWNDKDTASVPGKKTGEEDTETVLEGLKLLTSPEHSSLPPQAQIAANTPRKARFSLSWGQNHHLPLPLVGGAGAGTGKRKAGPFNA